MTENVKRGNPNLKGKAPGAGAIAKETSKEKFSEVWNSVSPKEGEKASDLLLIAFRKAGIANSHTDISQIRAFASTVRDAGFECKSFKSALILDQKRAFMAWKTTAKSDGSAADAAKKYAEMTGATSSIEEIKKAMVNLVRSVRALGVPVAKLAGEDDKTSRVFDKQKFCEIWQNAATLGDAVKGLRSAGIIGGKMDDDAAEKRANKIARELRGLKKKGVVVGITKNVSKKDANGEVVKDGEGNPLMEKVVIEPFMPTLKRFKRNVDAKKAAMLALLEEIDEELGEENEDSEESEENEDDDEDEENEENEENEDNEENEGGFDPFA